MKYSSIKLIVFFFIAGSVNAQTIDSLQAISTSEARQAVAVDNQYVYAINNSAIEKFVKEDGRLVASWSDTTGIFQHLNSGVIIEGKLYCAHSNFPDIPMASSIEVFDARTLTPIESHSLGIDIGSATWVDWYDGYWYVAFAHYHRFKDQIGKDNRWTQVVKFSEKWERLGGWILPPELLDRFESMSNSGGFIASSGEIYLTGHDFKEVYLLEFPRHGFTLEWTATLPAPFEGQGIAVDPENPDIIYGIQRSQKKIIRGKLTKSD